MSNFIYLLPNNYFSNDQCLILTNNWIKYESNKRKMFKVAENDKNTAILNVAEAQNVQFEVSWYILNNLNTRAKMT